MHFNQLKKKIRPLLDSGISIELISPPGLGKSTFVDDTIAVQSKVDGKKWGRSVLFLATQTPPDLIGYIMKGEMKLADGRVIPISQPTLPGWMITSEGNPVWEYERGVLLLDEYGQGEADVKRASAELLLNRQLGPWKLPPGWSVIACSNRASDRSGVTKSFDFVINRREEIHITPDLQSFEDWAFAKGVHPLFIAFANQHPQVVFEGKVPDKQGPWCTPRSLVMLEKMFRALSEDGGATMPDDADANELAAGMIGEAATAQLLTFIRLGNEMPKYEDIVKNPGAVKVPERPDARMLVTYNLAARVTRPDANAVVAYMERMPKEFAVTFCKSACKRDPQLIFESSLQKWSEKNASLLTVLVGG